MNVYSKLAIEVVRNNFNYCFDIPFGASYADAEQVAMDMAKQIAEMARVAAENAKKSEQKEPEVPCEAPCVEAELVQNN